MRESSPRGSGRFWIKTRLSARATRDSPGGVSTMESIMKLRMRIDEALRKGKPLFLYEENLNKAFDSPERAIKEIALKRIGIPESVVRFLAEIDDENEVHITTSCGATYDTPGLGKGMWVRHLRRCPSSRRQIRGQRFLRVCVRACGRPVRNLARDDLQTNWPSGRHLARRT